MVARRHQKIPRPFRRGRGQDRGLKFGKAGGDHAFAEGADHPGAQHDIAVHALPAQIQKAVFQPQLIRVVFIAGHLDRQHVGGRLQHQRLYFQLDFAGRQFGVLGAFGAGHHLAGDRDDRLHPQPFRLAEGRRAGGEYALGQPEMVPQIDEQQPAMVALGMNPAGKPGQAADIPCPQSSAMVGAVFMHRKIFHSLGKETRPPSLSTRPPCKT
jgi:hypothetical protein